MVSIGLGKKIGFPHIFAIAIAGCILTVGSFAIYRQVESRTSKSVVVSAPKPEVEKVSALGRLEPNGEVIKVFAPIFIDGARIETLNVSHGQQIRKGDVIAILDNYARNHAAFLEAQQQVEVEQARLKQVEAGAKTGQIIAQDIEVDRLQAELVTQTATQEATIARIKAELQNSELEARRYQELYIGGAVSASLRDTKQLAVVTFKQSVREARAGLNRIKLSTNKQIAQARATRAQIAEVRPVDVQLARTQVVQARAAALQAKEELNRSVVRSPQDGQVLKINTRPGERVGNEGIISLGQTKQMVAVAEIYELDISKTRVGQKATITSKNDAFPDILHGTVFEVGLEIGKKDVLNTDPAAQFDARVVEVKIHLDPESSRKVSGLSNLSLQIEIDTKSHST